MIKIENVTHAFGEKLLFSDFSLTLNDGIYALTGKSGSGKTTLIRIAAGLLKADKGQISVDTPISVSFQENRLFPWYTALKNVSIVSNEAKAKEILSELGLEDSLKKYPSELSGGMKRRVSLARALAADSKTILLDEPFAGLDDTTAQNTLSIIRKYSANKVVLISTHNIGITKKLDDIINIDPSV